MTIEQAISHCYGVTFLRIPDDGVMRVFRIDGEPNGFVINLGDCGAFGDWQAEEGFAWDVEGFRPLSISACGGYAPLFGDALKHEQIIVGCAKGLIDRGEDLPIEDLSRFVLAIDRVRDSVGGQA